MSTRQFDIPVPRRVAWVIGLLSKRSCYRADGKPKQRYPSFGSAAMAAHSMWRKTEREFDVYWCPRCWFRDRLRRKSWHIGGTVDK